MNNVIDRWFPCSEVSEACEKPHGSGRIEKALFTWFASRPIAQARAAALTTLLPWPDDPVEETRLKNLITAAIRGHWPSMKALAAQIEPLGLRVLDPFSGRGIIPLEAVRAGAEAWGLDYSPVAALGGLLLAEYPFRDWQDEPCLPFKSTHLGVGPRLVADVRTLLNEVCERFEHDMDAFYPRNETSRRPWGYLWAQTIPCSNCGLRFPLVGSAVLRYPGRGGRDSGQSLRISTDRSNGELLVEAVDGAENGTPTFIPRDTGVKGSKVARCPFCLHPHGMKTVKAKAHTGELEDTLLLAADIDASVGKKFRAPTPAEIAAVALAKKALRLEPNFDFSLPAFPDEHIPEGNHDTVRASLYGAKTYGELCCERQTLGLIRLCKIIRQIDQELDHAGLSDDYRRALLGYCGALVVRKLRLSTRGATLRAHKGHGNTVQIHDIFQNQASLNYCYDFFEAGVGSGAGTLRSLAQDTVRALEQLLKVPATRAAKMRIGDAMRLPFRPASIDAIITDPPYYNMIDYTDISDIFYVWLKRALGGAFPELFDPTEPLQTKGHEIIVKRGGTAGEHRTKDFYRDCLTQAFVNARTVLKPTGAMTVVFGHSDPAAWVLLLDALMQAGFVVTGSWPARTESDAGGDGANIRVTITISCRMAPPGRDLGLQAAVDMEVARNVRERVRKWEYEGLALPDQLMASYGPAMEVVGRYREVIRPDGEPVDIPHYLALARRVVQESVAMKVDGLPLETFDARTRFALFWARLFPVRQVAAKSEAAFQAMAVNLKLDDVRGGILEEDGKRGFRLARFSTGSKATVSNDSSVIDTVRAMVQAWRHQGGGGVAEVLYRAGRDPDDTHLWATIAELPRYLPSGDPDRRAMEDIMRNRRALSTETAELRLQLTTKQLRFDLSGTPRIEV